MQPNCSSQSTDDANANVCGYVGCPNYFIFLDGGLKEILLVTSSVRKALVYSVLFVPSKHGPDPRVQMPEGQIIDYVFFSFS